MLAIHESVLARKPGPKQSHQSQQQPPHLSTHYNPLAAAWLPDLQRFDICQRCLASVHAWFERLFAWPLARFHCLPAGTFLQMFYVLVCLHKLTTLRDPAWSAEAARGVIDQFTTIDRILSMCHELRAMMGAGSAGSPEGLGGQSPTTRGTFASSSSVIEKDDHDAVLVAIRKFSTLRVVWQNEIMAQERERQEETAAAAEAAAAVSTATVAAAAAAAAAAGSSGSSTGAPSQQGVLPGPLLVDRQPAAGAVDLNGLGSLGGLGTPSLGTSSLDTTSLDTTSLDTMPLDVDFFSNYSLDVLNYYYAMPGQADMMW